jgi:hypothetical protein
MVVDEHESKDFEPNADAVNPLLAAKLQKPNLSQILKG